LLVYAFKPGGQVYSVSHYRIVHFIFCAHVTCHYAAGINPDTG